jgi:hypothetical protein
MQLPWMAGSSPAMEEELNMQRGNAIRLVTTDTSDPSAMAEDVKRLIAP